MCEHHQSLNPWHISHFLDKCVIGATNDCYFNPCPDGTVCTVHVYVLTLGALNFLIKTLETKGIFSI